MPFDFLLCTEFQTRAYNYNYALQLSVTSDIKLKLAEFKVKLGIKNFITAAWTPKVRLYIAIVLSCPLIGCRDTEIANQRAAQNNYMLHISRLWGLKYRTRAILGRS